MCELEVSYLNNDRERLADINNRDYRKEKMLSCHKSYRNDSAAEKHRPRVAHKYLCRVKIPYEEAKAAACNSYGVNGIFVVSHSGAERCERYHRNYSYRAAKSVNAVREVYSIREEHYNKEHKRIVEPADVKLCPVEIERCFRVAEDIQNIEEGRREDELHHHFLLRFESEVLLFYSLDIIVREADHHIQKSEDISCEQAGNQRAGFPKAR